LALVDTHCHLNLDAFQEDLPAVLDRAWKDGVERILIPGIDVDSSRQAVALAEEHPNLFAAVGVHPNDANTWDEKTYDILKELADHSKVVAVGEIGLDYYRDWAPRSKQLHILHLQLQLAAETNLPVVLHNRNALADLWPVMMQWQHGLESQASCLAKRPGVFHSYDGDLETALQAVERHFFIGISGPVTFRNAPDRQQVAARLPIRSILLETDAPFLAPHPRRGRRNEPAYVRLVAEKVAELHQVSVSSLSQLTTENAGHLFSWERPIEY
jgi:TatD DNase family protein